ncbi:MAG: hypothetical protein IJJ47_13190 [Methanosphaera sp.]|nr:hypothetical protein [Methanosphaera sp.]
MAIIINKNCYIIEVSTTFSTSPIVRQLRLEDATMELNRLKELMKKQDYKNKKNAQTKRKKTSTN